MTDTDDEHTTELESHLTVADSYDPPASFRKQANVVDPDIYDTLEDGWPECWERAADMLTWREPHETVLEDEDAPFYRWFTGGRLNASENCLDRHVEAGHGDRVAIEWIGEPTDETETITYAELLDRVEAFAAGLRSIGVAEDDVVTLYLPMIPALPIAMLACARIGAPHSVVFAGFSAQALATRMAAADSEYLVTCDGYYRRGEALDHVAKAREGLDALDRTVTTVVVDRLGTGAGDGEGAAVEEGGRAGIGESEEAAVDNGARKAADGSAHLDAIESLPNATAYDYDELLETYRGESVEPVARDAEDMLFLMYTSGTTGQPKGVVHTTGGYLAYATWTSHAVLDLQPEDTYWCAADIGWITGHSYIVYGSLALGTTTLIYEGAPDYPERDRLWEIVEEYAVDVFYTAPTAIRAFMKWGPEYPARHDRSSLRLLGTVGEPINPRAWRWYHEHIGGGECPIVDTWWQTETGGMMITTLPAISAMKPGSAGPPLPGIDARVLDGDGAEIDPGADEAGYLTIHRPWPGMLRTLYGNDERFVEEYWREYSDPDADEWIYAPEDAATVDEDGYLTILGRVDDVITVAGHRLGTMELESAIVGVEGVAEAAVVAGPHEVKGQAINAFVILEDGVDAADRMRDRIETAVEDAIGPIARPESIVFTPELPKTRSGKIMRRLLEDVAAGDRLGDTSTLRNPEIVEEIAERVTRE